jgi:hypothetical protein
MAAKLAPENAQNSIHETQGGWLFVALECWVDSALEFAQEIEAKEHG